MTTDEIVFRLKPDVAQTVINAVTELPWRIANPIVNELLQQVQEQQKPKTEAAPKGK
jgi:hypothetical protein